MGRTATRQGARRHGCNGARTCPTWRSTSGGSKALCAPLCSSPPIEHRLDPCPQRAHTLPLATRTTRTRTDTSLFPHLPMPLFFVRHGIAVLYNNLVHAFFGTMPLRTVCWSLIGRVGRSLGHAAAMPEHITRCHPALCQSARRDGEKAFGDEPARSLPACLAPRLSLCSFLVPERREQERERRRFSLYCKALLFREPFPVTHRVYLVPYPTSCGQSAQCEYETESSLLQN